MCSLLSDVWRPHTRRGDYWVQCLGCKAWFHETCAEVVGILVEAEFNCRDCVTVQCCQAYVMLTVDHMLKFLRLHHNE